MLCFVLFCFCFFVLVCRGYWLDGGYSCAWFAGIVGVSYWLLFFVCSVSCFVFFVCSVSCFCFLLFSLPGLLAWWGLLMGCAGATGFGGGFPPFVMRLGLLVVVAMADAGVTSLAGQWSFSGVALSFSMCCCPFLLGILSLSSSSCSSSHASRRL